jgi:hypothetical protein
LSITNKAPTAPVLVSPSDNATNQPLEVNLAWTATDPEKDSLKYEVILRKDSSNDVVVYSEVSKSNYILKGLNYSTKYYWQISVSDGINPPVLSAIRALLRSLFQMRDSYSLRRK